MHQLSANCKARARFSILGHLGTCVGANITYFLAYLVLTNLVSSVIPVTGPLSYFASEVALWVILTLMGLLQYGMCSIYMNLLYKKPANRMLLFRGLSENTNNIIAVKAFIAGLQVLLLIPANYISLFHTNLPSGIYLSLYAVGSAVMFYLQLRYALVSYLMLDFPDLTPVKVLQYSAKLMKGHMLELFYITCSFLPLYLLSVLSLGIAALWVNAYESAVSAVFYRHVLTERTRKN